MIGILKELSAAAKARLYSPKLLSIESSWDKRLREFLVAVGSADIVLDSLEMLLWVIPPTTAIRVL